MGTLTLGVVGYTFNLRTQEAVAGGPCEFEHSLVYIQTRRDWGVVGEQHRHGLWEFQMGGLNVWFRLKKDCSKRKSQTN